MLRESARPHPANDHQLGHARRAEPAVLTAVSLAMDDGRCSVKTRLPLAGPRGLPMMKCASCGERAPPFLEGLAPTLFLNSQAAGCLQQHAAFEEEAQRASTKGTCMNPITRRSGAQRPRPQASSARTAARTHGKNSERYLTLGREAQLAGDSVEMECCYQFAGHYFRVMRAAAGLEPEDGRRRAHAYQPTTGRL